MGISCPKTALRVDSLSASKRVPKNTLCLLHLCTNSYQVYVYCFEASLKLHKTPKSVPGYGEAYRVTVRPDSKRPKDGFKSSQELLELLDGKSLAATLF